LKPHLSFARNIVHVYLTTFLQTSSWLPHPRSVPKLLSILWNRGILGAAVVLPLALVWAGGKTVGVKTAVSGDQGRLKGFDAPLPVRAIVGRACADCHSGETRWPWYSNIPPVSWQIQADVQNARAFMDLSQWNDYTGEERRGFASQIARATRAHVMPPPKYLWMHHDARLSSADLDVLKDWALRQSNEERPDPSH
jgi:hypothetical protein